MLPQRVEQAGRLEQGWGGLGKPDQPLGDWASEILAAGVLGSECKGQG